MRVMDNPWIVGGLCVIAVGLVGYQFLPARMLGGKATSPNGQALIPAASPASPTPGAPAQRASDPGRTDNRPALGTNAAPSITLIDLTYVQSHLAKWAESLERDPFRLSPPGKPAPGAVSPVSHWKLKAIWRQTGSGLAAINKDVYAEGDVIEGYKIEQIESDRVWFQGPTGRESLGFAKPQAPPHASQGANGTHH